MDTNEQVQRVKKILSHYSGKYAIASLALSTIALFTLLLVFNDVVKVMAIAAAVICTQCCIGIRMIVSSRQALKVIVSLEHGISR
jgi:hypothetical protein